MPLDQAGFNIGKISQDEIALRVLRKMRIALKRPGSWTQGALTKHAKHCIIGWVEECCVDECVPDSRRFVVQHLAPVLPVSYQWRDATSGLIAFNDKPSRRKRAVIKVVDRAIAKLEAA